MEGKLLLNLVAAKLVKKEGPTPDQIANWLSKVKKRREQSKFGSFKCDS